MGSLKWSCLLYTSLITRRCLEHDFGAEAVYPDTISYRTEGLAHETGEDVYKRQLQLKVLMGMESDVKVAVEGNLKDYEMSMFTRQAMPRPDKMCIRDSSGTVRWTWWSDFPIYDPL